MRLCTLAQSGLITVDQDVMSFMYAAVNTCQDYNMNKKMEPRIKPRRTIM